MKISISLEALTGTFVTDLKRASKAAEQEAKRIADEFKTAGAAIGVAVAAGVAGLSVAIKSAINEADELSKAAQKIGIGIEPLSGLKYAAQLADVSFEDLTSSLAKFNKVTLEAQNGNAAAADAFKAVGISVADLKSQSPDQLLARISDAFAGASDDASKSAVAMALFGRSGANLIPLLNGGADSIKQLTDEAKLFGITVDQTTGTAAENFNDNLTRLHTAASGLASGLAREVLPALVDASNAVVDLVKKAEASGAFIGLKDGVRDFAEGAAITLAVVGESIVGVVKLVDALASSFKVVAYDAAVAGQAVKAAFYFGLDSTENDKLKALLEQRRKVLQDSGKSYQDLIDYQGDAVSKALREGFTNEAKARGVPASPAAAGPAKPSLPFSSSSQAAKDAADALKNALEQIKQRIAEERDSFAQQGVDLDRLFKQNQISIADYYDGKIKTVAEGANTIAAEYDREIAALQKFIATSSDATKTADAKTQLLGVEAERRKAIAEAQQKAVDLLLEERQATKDYSNDVERLNIQLLELAGNTEEAARRSFDLSNQQIRDRAKAQGDSGTLDLVNRLESATVAQAKFNELKQQAQDITDAQALAEQRLHIEQDAGQRGEFETLSKIGDLRTGEVEQLRAIGAEMTRVANASGIKAQIDEAKKFNDALVELSAQADVLGEKIKSVFEDDFANSLAGVIDGTKSLASAFHDLTRSIISDLSKIAAQDIAKKIFGSLNFSSGSGGGGFNLGSLFGGGNGAQADALVNSTSAAMGDSTIFGGGSGAGFLASIGSFFSGLGFADGGSPPVGMASLVGERGPELFIPRTAGTIVPNHALRGGPQITQNFTVMAPDGRISRSTDAQLRLTAARAVQSAQRRDG